MKVIDGYGSRMKIGLWNVSIALDYFVMKLVREFL